MMRSVPKFGTARRARPLRPRPPQPRPARRLAHGGSSSRRSVPLSPSAIARRLRRLRSEGLDCADDRPAPTSAHRHATSRDRHASAERACRPARQGGLDRSGSRAAHQVQFCYEIAGTHDLLAAVRLREHGRVQQLARGRARPPTRPCDVTRPASSSARRSSRPS